LGKVFFKLPMYLTSVYKTQYVIHVSSLIFTFFKRFKWMNLCMQKKHLCSEYQCKMI
jgi:hypothetical protein